MADEEVNGLDNVREPTVSDSTDCRRRHTILLGCGAALKDGRQSSCGLETERAVAAFAAERVLSEQTIDALIELAEIIRSIPMPPDGLDGVPLAPDVWRTTNKPS